MKEYQERSGLDISSGNFYRELQRLAAEGLVKTTANPPGDDPRRAPYEIADAGREAFDTWLSGISTVILGVYEDELSARALFIGDADAPMARKVLDQWQEQLWVVGKTLERQRQIALTKANARSQALFSPLPLFLARRLKHIAADLEFVDELRSSYNEWEAASRSASGSNRKGVDSNRSKGQEEVHPTATRKRPR
jgi:DNA-binding PadR family transcriptional regulator